MKETEETDDEASEPSENDTTTAAPSSTLAPSVQPSASLPPSLPPMSVHDLTTRAAHAQETTTTVITVSSFTLYL